MSYTGTVVGLRPGQGAWRELLLETGRGLMLFLVRPDAPWEFVVGAKIEVTHDRLGAVDEVATVTEVDQPKTTGRPDDSDHSVRRRRTTRKTSKLEQGRLF